MKSLSRLNKELGGRGCGTKIKEELVFRLYRAGEDRIAAVFSLAGSLCNKMRWMHGDRIDVLYDPAQMEGQLVRCKDGGWCLSNSGGQKGDCARKQIRIAIRREYGLPTSDVKITWECTDNTIAFKFNK
jgi:hypothetical protein